MLEATQEKAERILRDSNHSHVYSTEMKNNLAFMSEKLAHHESSISSKVYHIQLFDPVQSALPRLPRVTQKMLMSLAST